MIHISFLSFPLEGIKVFTLVEVHVRSRDTAKASHLKEVRAHNGVESLPLCVADAEPF